MNMCVINTGTELKAGAHVKARPARKAEVFCYTHAIVDQEYVVSQEPSEQ